MYGDNRKWEEERKQKGECKKFEVWEGREGAGARGRGAEEFIKDNIKKRGRERERKQTKTEAESQNENLSCRFPLTAA